jgi:hypothetical protein
LVVDSVVGSSGDDFAIGVLGKLLHTNLQADHMTSRVSNWIAAG